MNDQKEMSKKKMPDEEFQPVELRKEDIKEVFEML